MNEFLSQITFRFLLKVGAILFLYAIGILVIISIILAMFGVYG